MVHGSVQGVGFRMAAAAEARRLGVAGHARNRFDGTVEAEVEGEADAVDGMRTWLDSGRTPGHVEHVEASDLETRGDVLFRIA